MYELNRQIVADYLNDIGGSITIFLFGGLVGTVASIILALTQNKPFLTDNPKYTANRFGTTTALLGASFCYIFFPFLHFDVPQVVGGFLISLGPLNCLYGMSAAVVTSLAMSAILYGRIHIKDLLYAPIAGAIITGTSSQFMFNPMAAIILGVIAGIIQPLFNMVEQKLANQIYFCSSAPFLFFIQGLLGGMAAGIMRAIKQNDSTFNFSTYPFQYNSINVTGEYFRATYISFGIALGTGVVLGLFFWLVAAQQKEDFF